MIVTGETDAPPERDLPLLTLVHDAVYNVIGYPPSVDGGRNDTHAVDPAVATVTSVGAAGRPAGVVSGAEDADGGPMPIRLAAFTRQV